jgi:transposase
MTYSIDFRRKVLSIKDKENLTIEETAKRFDVGVASVVRWSSRLEPCLTRNKPATKINTEALAKDVEMYPDDYQYERAARFNVSQRGIGDALKRLKISHKKSLEHPKADPEKRQRFEEKIKSYEAENRPIIYIDESGFAHDMPRTHGYAPVGERCFGKQDWHAKGRVNVIGALLASCLLTVSLFTGSINANVFFAKTT